MKKNKLVFLAAFSLVLIIALTGLLAACGKSTPATTTGKPITLIFSSHDPAGGSWAETYGPFFAEIEQRTGGMVKIEQHWSGELAGLFEQYDAVADGTVDMGHVLPTLSPNTFPMEDVNSLSSFDVKHLGDSQQATELNSLFPEMQAAYTKSGTKLIFKVSTFPNYFGMTKGKAIRTFADAAGKKYLSIGPWDSATVKALGMTPVSSMPQETYSFLQTGLMDGLTVTMPFVFDFGVGDLTTKISVLGARSAIWALVMNLDTWNSLPAEHQKIIQEAAAKVPARQDQIQLRLDRDLRVKATQQWGTEFIEIPQAELAKFTAATAPVRASFVAELNKAGLPGQKLLDEYLRLEKKYSGSEYALK